MTERMDRAISRRAFVTRLVGSGAAIASTAALLDARVLGAQQPAPPGMSSMDSSNLFAMNQTASLPVRLPPKPGARPSMTNAARDELEHRIRCQCGCTLDVYTCRTTDFSCQVSPAMHADVMGLVQGGYSAQEILDAFVGVYGERVLMAPSKEGFNLFGWTAPFLALLGGGIAVAVLIRRWSRGTAAGAPAMTPGAALQSPSRIGAPMDASDEELRRLDAAVREDG